MGSIFAIIELILKAMNLWDQFISWSDAKRLAEEERKTQERNSAIDRQNNAKDESEFDHAQDDIVNNKP